jgi:DNA-binding CsgD family transcriptional regulator
MIHRGQETLCPTCGNPTGHATVVLTDFEAKLMANGFTKLQAKIVHRMMNDVTVKDIANEFNVGIPAIKYHVGKIYKLLDIKHVNGTMRGRAQLRDAVEKL